ncbi:hypothetical protein M9Y10_016101 [Tritrichomonas musculus]|uniref:Integrase catalytic domain-containing protein n=1 Tax=Tritrichomonas musculus TaxID=1915356 RepID=A0ABR2I5B4_9EUKA
MKGKGAKEVAKALNKFLKDKIEVYSITSDQDAPYLSNDVLQIMKVNNIVYTTTEDNNHYVLGIINRFMRTTRDMVGENRYINEKEMNDLIDSYNTSPHRSLDYMIPNEMTKEDEKEYIKTKSHNNPYDFKPNDRVKIIQAKEPFAKRRNKVSKEAYIVDSKAGKQFIIKSKDESIDKLPGYRLIKTTNKNIAQKNKYKIKYSEGTEE